MTFENNEFWVAVFAQEHQKTFIWLWKIIPTEDSFIFLEKGEKGFLRERQVDF